MPGGINKAKSRRHGHLAPYYERQKLKTSRNLLMKLHKHVKTHPNDVRAKTQLETNPPKVEYAGDKKASSSVKKK